MSVEFTTKYKLALDQWQFVGYRYLVVNSTNISVFYPPPQSYSSLVGGFLATYTYLFLLSNVTLPLIHGG